MSKRKYLIFFTLVFAIVAMFAASEVMANHDGCEDPATTCTAGNWTVELTGPGTKTTCTDGVTIYDCWPYSYKVYRTATGDTNGLNHVNFLVPDCCDVEKKVLIFESTSDLVEHVYPVGEGEPTLGFGRWLQEFYVTRFEPNQPDSKTWSFYATTDRLCTTTVALNTGDLKKDLSTCEIAGPCCQVEPCYPKLPEGAPRGTLIGTNLLGLDICVEVIDQERCTVKVWQAACDNLTGATEIPAGDPIDVEVDGEEHTVRIISRLNDADLCAVNVMYLNPCVYYLYIGGASYPVSIPCSASPVCCP